MTLDNTNTNDEDITSVSKEDNKVIEPVSDESSTCSSILPEEAKPTNEKTKPPSNSNEHHDNNAEICYNKILDDEIRSRLEKLNAFSDLINSLERQFDEANSLFRSTLKCSTERLSLIARTLGSKSIRRSRIYHAAKLSVEQNQSDCQKACIQFEQANKDHQLAKKAIKDAELKLREVALKRDDVAGTISSIFDSIDMQKLNLDDSGTKSNICDLKACDSNDEDSKTNTIETNSIDSQVLTSTTTVVEQPSIDGESIAPEEACNGNVSSTTNLVKNSAKLSEELNQAIMKLLEAERKRGLSERQHLDQANKLMIAQENLIKLEREYGTSIRRSQFYFDEARRFNAKLGSVKGEICKISQDILAAKQAYAQTLSELERFSDDLHDNPGVIANTDREIVN